MNTTDIIKAALTNGEVTHTYVDVTGDEKTHHEIKLTDEGAKEYIEKELHGSKMYLLEKYGVKVKA